MCTDMGGSVVKNLPDSVGDVDSIPESGRSPVVGNGNSSILAWEIPDRTAWWATVYRVTKNQM